MNYLKYLFKRLVYWTGNLVFDKRYFKGSDFEINGIGWKWILRALWQQKILRINAKYDIPIHVASKVSKLENLEVGSNGIRFLQATGIYVSNWNAKVKIGNNVHIAPNVGLITANHNLKKPEIHDEAKDIIIEDDCWIGMNAVILPGVKLKKNTVVAAGAVVNKSFEEGSIMIAGVPARKVKDV